MGTRSGTVYINGNGYDATTGQIINAFKTANRTTTQVIDGFVSRPSRNISAAAVKRRQVKKSEEVHKRPQKTRTLMRGGLKKPENAPNGTIIRSAFPRISTQLRAKTIRRHSQIEHFGNPIKSNGSKTGQAVSGEIVSSGGRSEARASTAAAPLPSMLASASHQKLERLLDEALTRADSHKQALRYHAARHFWQRRWFNGPVRLITAGAALLILIAALAYTWSNVPQLSMKVAGLRAHVSAAVPSYKPDGFKVAGPAKAVSGAVVVKYQSSADQAKTYDITEQPSDITSTMISQNVVPKGASVQTSQVQGNTVYIYGNSNDAAWVNNGVLYTIKNRSSLGSDQLIQIVSGLNP